MINIIISKFQNICVYINFFILFPIFILFLEKSYFHLNDWELNKHKHSYLSKPKFKDIYYILFFTSFLIVLRLYWKRYINKNLKKKYIQFSDDNTDDLNLKYEKIYTGSFKFIYFIFTTLWGFHILYKSNYIPKSLGGNLNGNEFIKICLKDLPFNNIDTYELKIYYFWNLSYHIMSTLFHLKQINRKNWDEMTMHHIITILLITFSYILGILKIGHIIMIIHDITDIFIYLSKTLNELKIKKKIILSIIYIVGLVFFFGYFRIYVFSLNIVYPLLIINKNENNFKHLIYYFNILLTLLLSLHLYWYVLILYMIAKFIQNKKIKDKNEEYKR